VRRPIDRWLNTLAHHDSHPSAGENPDELQTGIAFRIRAELVCCDIYEKVNDRREMILDEASQSHDWHDICYWGEAAARIAEGRCPGYETKPNICRCMCAGCAHNCSAHDERDADDQS
jgi:hypothetical protein